MLNIQCSTPKAALQEEANTPKAPTKPAVENLKAETKVEPKESMEGEKRWPARDFPY